LGFGTGSDPTIQPMKIRKEPCHRQSNWTKRLCAYIISLYLHDIGSLTCDPYWGSIRSPTTLRIGRRKNLLWHASVKVMDTLNIAFVNRHQWFWMLLSKTSEDQRLSQCKSNIVKLDYEKKHHFLFYMIIFIYDILWWQNDPSTCIFFCKF
jgi:hypothetical protein